MTRILSILLSLVLSQGPSLPYPGKGTAATFVAATFIQYTFVANSGGSSIASITSPAITLTAGSFVYVFCRAGDTTAGNTIVVTSSPANTFTALTSRGSGSGVATAQASYAFGVASGSTTFTCTVHPFNMPSQSMIVLEYTPGSITTIDVDLLGQLSSPSTSTTVNTPTSFTTASGGLILWCATANAVGMTWTAGSIGSATGTIRGFSAATNSSDAGCEDSTPSTSQTSITATMTINVAHSYTGELATFK